MPQVCIDPKEVAQLPGAKYGTAKILLQRIRAGLNKPARNYVSIAEFYHHTHLSKEEVIRALLNQDQCNGPNLKHEKCISNHPRPVLPLNW